ncbi:MAG: hypothetical protein ACP5RC_11825, partial [Halothiobacillaceae bacterium]
GRRGHAPRRDELKKSMDGFFQHLHRVIYALLHGPARAGHPFDDFQLFDASTGLDWAALW